jgi:hypothetical protein
MLQFNTVHLTYTVIFMYTFYWTLIFYTPAFVFCAAFAFVNLSFPPGRRMHRVLHKQAPETHHEIHELVDANTFGHAENHPMLAVVPPPGGIRPPRAPRPNERRSRLTFALLVLLAYLACGLAGAVLSSLIGGYILAGLYGSANFNMST